MLPLPDFDLPDPSPDDLTAIEAEMPLIDDELAVLDAEIAIIYAAERGGPTPLDWRRLRRAEATATRTAVELAAQARRRAHMCDPWRMTEGRLSDCRYGCKVMHCTDCGAETVEHRAAYGCPAGHHPTTRTLGEVA